MNPICETDINSPECQTWMNKVCAHCRELFAREATNTWAAWWHDETPVFYKDVPEMTVYDCSKLKNLLEQEVAALHSSKTIAYPSKSFNFKLWQKNVGRKTGPWMKKKRNHPAQHLRNQIIHHCSKTMYQSPTSVSLLKVGCAKDVVRSSYTTRLPCDGSKPNTGRRNS
ncbi:uncharacterized protein LOC117780608 isoform X2 [Drosophila innubila]|uniref:uncharacterized protein LOC117780608 isoform X2 n=1 Tax=Drosophila innubila TaxID=198719 RepID=UPI00148C642E|nr:uncharacterized protein LOC117780608 isoform X2 [Drosophila innubila]